MELHFHCVGTMTTPLKVVISVYMEGVGLKGEGLKGEGGLRIRDITDSEKLGQCPSLVLTF